MLKDKETTLDKSIDVLIARLDDFVRTNMGQARPNLRQALQDFAAEVTRTEKKNNGLKENK